jgi:hypothetical protein
MRGRSKFDVALCQFSVPKPGMPDIYEAALRLASSGNGGVTVSFRVARTREYDPRRPLSVAAYRQPRGTVGLVSYVVLSTNLNRISSLIHIT